MAKIRKYNAFALLDGGGYGAYTKRMEHHQLIIIGGGPAGLTAGIYAARGGVDVVIIEKGAAGGLASLAANVENYPGVPAKSGFDISYEMLEQAKRSGAKFVFDEISSLSLSQKRMTLKGGDVLTADYLILALGAEPRKLGLNGEARLTGNGVSYCATCDGALFRGRTVAVIGGGNTAAEDALYLEKLAAKVYMVHRRDALRADKILADRVSSSRIEVLWDSVVTQLIGEEKLTQIEVKNVKTGVLSVVNVDCVFVAIGQRPNTEGLDGIALDEGGYIITDEDMNTSIKGVLAAGDVRHKSLRQIVTACADGAIAANTVIHALG